MKAGNHVVIRSDEDETISDPVCRSDSLPTAAVSFKNSDLNSRGRSNATVVARPLIGFRQRKRIRDVVGPEGFLMVCKSQQYLRDLPF